MFPRWREFPELYQESLVSMWILNTQAGGWREDLREARTRAEQAMMADPNSLIEVEYNVLTDPDSGNERSSLDITNAVYDIIQRFVTDNDDHPTGAQSRRNFWLIHVGDRFFTLKPDAMFDLLVSLLNRAEYGGDAFEGDSSNYGSDQSLVDLIVLNTFRIYRPKPRRHHARQPNVQANAGQYFPYLHSYLCPKLTETLARIGIWSEVDPKNYQDNCLCKALEDAGVPNEVLEDLKESCMLRAIPRRILKEVAGRYNLRLEIRTQNSANVVRVGPESGQQIRLGLYLKHYFHDFQTEINSYALEHYHELYLSKEKWWNFKSQSRRDPARGMDAFKLIDTLMGMNTLTPINVSTENIFQTQFHDKAARDFTTLEYPDGSVRETHPERFAHEPEGEHNKHIVTAISKMRLTMRQTPEGVTTSDRLTAKFTKLGMGLFEQQACLRRHSIPAARIFFDFESTTDGAIHKAYMVCWAVDGESTVHTAIGEHCAIEFLTWVAIKYGMSVDWEGAIKQAPPSVTIIAHNITYDAAFIMEYLTQLRMIEKGTSIVAGSGLYRARGAARVSDSFDSTRDRLVSLQFKDSCKMIVGSLASFAGKFKLDCVKEVMPYEIYTEHFIQSGALASSEDLADCKDHTQLMSNLEEWGCGTPDGWDMMAYSARYCVADVKLLMAGWNVFRKDTLVHTDIDVNYYPTTASLADTHLTEQGCYSGVQEVSGVVREFISRCNVGGRVMCRNNEPSCVEEDLDDLDAVSLYPSAMVLCPGYLKGAPKVWTAGVDLESMDGYFLEIKVLAVPRKWAFPLTHLQTERGNCWTSDLEGETIYVDRTTLEELKCYSSIPGGEQFNYQILQGYYYDSGFNPKVKEVMRHLFEVRLELKRQKSSAQEGIKLMMNSAYGKCGLRPIDCDVTYCSGEKAVSFMHNHHNHLKHFTVMLNGTYRFESYKAINQHFNKQHLSCSILSYSKRLMNRPMCLAEEMGIQIHYTDTDSMHIQAQKVELLSAEFERRYGTGMLGSGIGQFHVDFDFKSSYMRSADGKLTAMTESPIGAIISKQAIFLGKKSYIDRLVDTSGQEAYHIRLKGIPNRCILSTCNQKFDGDPMAMFQHLFDENQVGFDLGSDGHCMFKTNKDHSVKSQKLTRTIGFKTKA